MSAQGDLYVEEIKVVVGPDDGEHQIVTRFVGQHYL